MSATDTHIQKPDTSKRNRNILIGGGTVLLVLLIALLIWFLRPTGPSIRELLAQSHAYYAQEYADIATLAEAVETPEAALDFAHNNISLSIYQGRLQTAEEVLKTRTANPADKAMFLAALLEALGIETVAQAAPLPENMRPGLVQSQRVIEKPLPDAMDQLLDRIGYDRADQQEFAKTIFDATEPALADLQSTASNALAQVQTIAPFDGQSTIQTAYIDWVWLEDDEGNIYDPLLPDEARPVTARFFDAQITSPRISLTAINAYGDVNEMLSFEGTGYGEPIVVSFVPTIDTLNRMVGEPDLSDVGLWTPVLSLGAENIVGTPVDTAGDVVPPAMVDAWIESGQAPTFEAPALRDLTIRAIDTSAWPRVTVSLGASVGGQPVWHPAHFALSADGDGRPVRIERGYSVERNVITVFDQSGSMLDADHYVWARQFADELLQGLAGQQRFGLISYGNDPVVHKLFEQAMPENGPALAALESALTQPVQGTKDFTHGLEHALNAIRIELGETPAEATSIVLVTDGRSGSLVSYSWQARIDFLLERAKALNVSIYPVVTGAGEDADLARLAQETGGRFIRVTQSELVAGAAKTLASELAGGMAISFRLAATSGYQVGDNVALSLGVEGYDGELTDQFVVPEAIIPRQPGIYVGFGSGEASTLRPLLVLGDNYDYRRMVGRYEAYLAAGPYNANQVIAAKLDDWLTYYDVRAGDDEALEARAAAPRVSAGEMQTVNTLSTLTELSLSPDQHMRFPLLVLNRTYPGRAEINGEEQTVLTRAIDVPAWVPLLSNGADKAEFALAGLMMNSAEARLIDGNDQTAVLAQGGLLDQTGSDGWQGIIDNSSLAPSLRSMLLAHQDSSNLYWHLKPETGQLRGFGIWDDVPLKGSRDTQIAAEFDRLQKVIGAYNYGVGKASAAAAAVYGAAPMTGVASLAYAGIVSFKSEELKLWCYASIMLGYVGESMSGDDEEILNRSVPEAESRAASLCKMQGGPEDFAKNAMREAAKGFVTEWANQFELPSADPTKDARDQWDRMRNIYDTIYPTPKPGEKAPDRSRAEIVLDVLNTLASETTPQQDLVNEVFSWGSSGFSPKFHDNLASAIQAEVR